MKYRALALTATLALAACGGGSDGQSISTEPDPVVADDAVEEFAGPSIDAAAVCAALPVDRIEALFGFAEFFSGGPSTLEGRASCEYSASNEDASVLVNASVSIENEGGAAGFAATVEKWEAIGDVVPTAGTGDDAVTVTDSIGHEFMFVLNGDRVLAIRASTVSSDKSIVDVLPEMAELAVAAL